MVRSVEAWDGLAALGLGRVGPLPIHVPSLLVPEGAAAPTGFPTVRLRTEPPSGSGRRRYRVGEDDLSVSFELSIPTPDLTSGGGWPPRLDGSVAFVRGPVTAEDLRSSIPEPPELVVLTNARTLFGEAEPFVSSIAAIRTAWGPRPLLWTPRVALPNRVPALLYVGADLLDPTEILADSAAGGFVDPELGRLPADAPGLADAATSPSEGPAARTLGVLARELRRATAAARLGRLRELVESRLPSEPVLGEILRFADRGLYGMLEERTPVTGQGVRAYVLRESFRRPESRRFRERVIERYVPPPSKSILLLVPCSKTKPYRNSRSHRRFASAWEEVPAPERIHVVSVTSPLGLVPRDLEDVPPARHYDIPVTGDWDELERGAVLSAGRSILTRGRYERIIVHLDPREYEFLAPLFDGRTDVVWTVPDDRPTGAAALDALKRALRSALETAPPSPGPMPVVREELRALGAWQFGAVGAARLLAEPVRLHGRPWFQRISEPGGQDLATWREERGLFQLTAAGGARMGLESGNAVEVAEAVPLEGDLFDPGVVRADSGIRIGDAVVLGRGGRVVAVGEAALPGPAMGRLGRGLAVRVRHRAHPGSAGDSEIEPPVMAPPGRSSSG